VIQFRNGAERLGVEHALISQSAKDQYDHQLSVQNDECMLLKHQLTDLQTRFGQGETP
jgi:hypothetical protein